MIKFSVCMSVYKNDNPVDFRTSIESVTVKQRLKPNELVLVVDGPIPIGIDQVINYFEETLSIPFNVIRLAKNCGHATARQTGLNAAKYEYVAIMDSDDISLPDRFEKQISFLEKHKDVDVLGGITMNFIGKVENIVGQRIVPQTDDDIKIFMKSRCPMNLVTVMGKAASIQYVGGYKEWFCEEDYYLWIRMMFANFKFANLPDILVNVRVGEAVYARRGGWRYFKSESKLQKYMYDHGAISLAKLIYNIIGRLIIQVLMPNGMRGYMFKTFFRKK